MAAGVMAVYAHFRFGAVTARMVPTTIQPSIRIGGDEHEQTDQGLYNMVIL